MKFEKLIFVLTLLALVSCKKQETEQSSIVKVYVPNAFYPGSAQPCPNSDMDPDCNKTFHVIVSDVAKLKGFALEVADVDGVRLFFTNDHRIPWDGRYQGITMPQNTYYYQVKYTDINGSGYVLRGAVDLIR